MKRIILVIAWCSIFGFSTLLVIVTYWSAYPFKLLEVYNQPMPVLAAEYRIGDILHYKSNYCKYTNAIPSLVKRQLVDGYVYDLPASSSANFPSGCKEVIVSVPLTLPASIPAGKYYLLITVEYKPNPIRTITQTYKTEQFNLIK